MAVPQVAVKQQRTLVRGIRKAAFKLRIYMSRGDSDILPPIIVEVLEAGSPADKSVVDGQPAGARVIFKQALTHVAIQHGQVSREVGLEDIEMSISVAVVRGGAHACLLLPILAIGKTAHPALFAECSVVVVDEQKARAGVACYVDIRPAIIVEIDRKSTRLNSSHLGSSYAV